MQQHQGWPIVRPLGNVKFYIAGIEELLTEGGVHLAV
jgi:hypothetical protein